MLNTAFSMVSINIYMSEWVKEYELAQTFVFDINRIRLSCYFSQVLKYRVNNGYYSACFHDTFNYLCGEGVRSSYSIFLSRHLSYAFSVGILGASEE